MLNSLLAGAEKPGGSTFFPAHDSRLLHALEVEAPHIYLQLPFRAVPNMGLVAPEASDLVEELVYRVGAAGARDVCEELANRRFTASNSCTTSTAISCSLQVGDAMAHGPLRMHAQHGCLVH